MDMKKETNPPQGITNDEGLLFTLLLVLVTLVVGVGACRHRNPDDILRRNRAIVEATTNKVEQQPVVCRDTNGPLDWRNNK